jgi:hypothetical protein
MNEVASGEDGCSVRVDKGTASTAGCHSMDVLKYIIQSAAQLHDIALLLLPLLLVFLLPLTLLYFLFFLPILLHSLYVATKKVVGVFKCSGSTYRKKAFAQEWEYTRKYHHHHHHHHVNEAVGVFPAP